MYSMGPEDVTAAVTGLAAPSFETARLLASENGDGTSAPTTPRRLETRLPRWRRVVSKLATTLPARAPVATASATPAGLDVTIGGPAWVSPANVLRVRRLHPKVPTQLVPATKPSPHPPAADDEHLLAQSPERFSNVPIRSAIGCPPPGLMHQYTSDPTGRCLVNSEFDPVTQRRCRAPCRPAWV